MTKAVITTSPASALGYSILANLGDEKQLTVQCFVDSEEPLADIHSKLDKAMAIVDRLKAKNRRVDLLAEWSRCKVSSMFGQEDKSQRKSLERRSQFSLHQKTENNSSLQSEYTIVRSQLH